MKKTMSFFLGLSLTLALTFALGWTAGKEGQNKKAKPAASEPCDNCTEPKKTVSEAGVLAVVNGRKITEKDLSLQFYLMKKQLLDQQIASLLLEEEAKRKNMNLQEVLRAEVMLKQKPVTEEEAKKFYNENKARLRGDFETIKSQLIQSLQGRQRQQLVQAFIDQLREKGDVKIFLQEPAFAVSSDDDPAKGGGREAPVTIVEFTDFE